MKATLNQRSVSGLVALSDRDGSDVERDCRQLDLPRERLQKALAMEASNWCGDGGSEGAEEECMQSKTYYAEVQRACKLWNATASGGARLDDAAAGNMHSGMHHAILQALKQDVDSEEEVMPFSGRRRPRPLSIGGMRDSMWIAG